MRHTGKSKRTIERRLAAGKIRGAYRTKGGHWRLCNTRQPWLRFLEKNSDLIKQLGDFPQHGHARLHKVMQASMALRGISQADCDERYESLRKRKPEIAELLWNRPLREFIHPRAIEVLNHPEGLLMIHAERLLADQVEITPQTLAASLGIVVSTLYDRYGQKAIKKACRLEKEHSARTKLTRTEEAKSTEHYQPVTPVWVAKHPRRRAA
jgi:hypothetical protein